jgi:site-specific DNA recombinase
MSGEWRGEQDRCQREIERHQTADQSYLEGGVRILELAQNAQRRFENQEPREKRRVLNFLVSNCSWKGGELSTVLRQPFDLLAGTTAFAAQAARDGRRNVTKSEIWLPGPDSNQRPTG